MATQLTDPANLLYTEMSQTQKLATKRDWGRRCVSVQAVIGKTGSVHPPNSPYSLRRVNFTKGIIIFPSINLSELICSIRHHPIRGFQAIILSLAMTTLTSPPANILIF